MDLDWMPDEASLGQIIQLLKESQNPDTETQRSVEQVSKEVVFVCMVYCCRWCVSYTHTRTHSYTHTYTHSYTHTHARTHGDRTHVYLTQTHTYINLRVFGL